MLLKDFIASSRQALSGIYPPREAAALVERLCTDHLGLRPHAHILEPDMQLEGALLDKANAALGRLCKSEPIQYICGWSEFYGRRFNVNSATLIPRPETEYLCRAAIEAANDSGKAYDELRILDLCTGSGCIAWTLACELPGAAVIGVDISPEALDVAKGQMAHAAEQHNDSDGELGRRLSGIGSRKGNGYDRPPHKAPDFLTCDILSGNAEEQLAEHGPYDIIVSNPPYILPEEAAQMRANVLLYEPETALFVPEDQPQLFNKKIALLSSKLLYTGGELFVEINERLPEQSAAVFEEAGLADISIIQDGPGKDRIVRAKKK